MIFTLKFVTIIAHFNMVGDIQNQFQYKLDDFGTISPPHFALGLIWEGDTTYVTTEMFVGTDSIGSATAGFGLSYGLYGRSGEYYLRFGVVMGGYLNDERKWGKYNDSLSVNLSNNWALVPMFGGEVVFGKQITDRLAISITNRNFFVISNLTFGFEYNF